jgi:hypothetical protein
MFQPEPRNVNHLVDLANSCLNTAKFIPGVKFPKASKFLKRIPEVTRKGLEAFDMERVQQIQVTGPINPLQVFPFGIFSAALECYKRTSEIFKRPTSSSSGTIFAAAYLSLNLKDRIFEVHETASGKQLIVEVSKTKMLAIDFGFNKDQIFLGDLKDYPQAAKLSPSNTSKDSLALQIRCLIAAHSQGSGLNLDQMIDHIQNMWERSAIKQILKLSLGSPYWKECASLFKKEDPSVFYLVNLINRSADSHIFARALTTLIHLMPETSVIKGWCKGNSLHLVINSLRPADLARYCKAVNQPASPVTLQQLASKADRDGLTPLMRAYVQRNSLGIELLSEFSGNEVDNYGYSVADYQRIFAVRN